jgi:hypothetical protein
MWKRFVENPARKHGAPFADNLAGKPADPCTPSIAVALRAGTPLSPGFPSGLPVFNK